MKYILTFLLLAASLLSHAQITHDFRNTPLLEALQTIGREQTDYTIDILSDSLGNLHTSAKVKDLSVPDAVKRICKGQPVKVKRSGKHIFIQYRPEKDFTNRTIHLSGEVLDEFLKIPLPKAKISVLRADSSVVVDSADMVNFYRSNMQLVKVVFGAEVKATEKTFWVRAQLEGYGDVWQRVDITDPSQTDVDVPALKMRKMPSRMLKGVTVTATRIKMFYRGDTIVYDATAFQLPEGSMLDELIRQLPGVKMNENGEIFVNGRKVDELLLGSRTFFGGNKKVLMENLPYYTVKHLKVYEKQTDRSVALGYDVEPRSYVMDVILKDEYSQGYIANAEVAGGTNERWLGRGFLLGFTDRLRLTLLANANNVNESRHVGQSGQWSPARAPKSLLTTRSVAGEINYQSEGDKLKETLRAEYTASTDEQTMNQRREQFLEELAPTSLTESYNRAGNKKWTVNNTLVLSKPMYLRTEAHFDYAKRDGWFHSAFDEWSESLSVSQRTIGMSEGKAWAAYLEASGSFNINKQKQQHLTFYAKVERNNDESRQAQRYTQTVQPNASQPLRSTVSPSSQTQRNTHDFFRRFTWAAGDLGYNLHFAKDINLLFTDFFNIRREHTRDFLYHPEGLQGGDDTPEVSLLLPSQIEALTAITDPGNSYESRRNDWTNNLTIRLMRTASIMSADFHMKMTYERWCLYIRTPIHHDELHYQRGVLDTLARQTDFLPNFSFDYKNYWKGARRNVRVGLSFNQEWPLIFDRITFRDDSQPLIVKLGNPDLKGKAYTKFEAEYFDNAGPNHGMCYLSASFNYHHRDVAQSLTYNPANGVYTYKPMNVSGAWGALANFSIDRNIGEKRYWSWHANAHALWDHAKDHAMLEREGDGGSGSGMVESHVNTVNTLGLKGGAHIKYNKNAFNIRATGQVYWRHSTGRMYDFKTLDVFDFEYGFDARYTLPRLKTSLVADATMYSRRGYGSSSLNTNDFIVNASVSQPFCKGKLIARLEAFDLLHQLSNTDYVVNAQGRTVTWYRSLPHYVMLHLVYHWNKNPKKK